jgi:hypothetical protein
MKHVAVFGLIALAGCASLLAPTPQVARLSDQTLSVTLNTGEICRVQWRDAPSGHICGFGYIVTETGSSNLLRQVFVDLTAAVGASRHVTPMAEVELVSPNGQTYRFVSPEPVEMN